MCHLFPPSGGVLVMVKTGQGFVLGAFTGSSPHTDLFVGEPTSPSLLLLFRRWMFLWLLAWDTFGVFILLLSSEG